MSAWTINQAIQVLCNLKVPASTSFAFLHLWILNKNNLCFHLSDPRCKHVFLWINLNKRYVLQASVSYTCTCNRLGLPPDFPLIFYFFLQYVWHRGHEILWSNRYKYKIDIMSQFFDWNYLPLKNNLKKVTSLCKNMFKCHKYFTSVTKSTLTMDI